MELKGMRTVTMLELRRDAEGVLRRVKRGEHLVLTRRGEPVARLEPLVLGADVGDDPFYRLGELACDGPSLDNSQIDEALYGADSRPSGRPGSALGVLKPHPPMQARDRDREGGGQRGDEQERQAEEPEPEPEAGARRVVRSQENRSVDCDDDCDG